MYGITGERMVEIFAEHPDGMSARQFVDILMSEIPGASRMPAEAKAEFLSNPDSIMEELEEQGVVRSESTAEGTRWYLGDRFKDH